jgi:hypothetical protein
VGDSLHVRDIKVEGVEILTDSDATVVTVVPPTVEEVVATPEGVAAAGTPEPEVVGAKGKKDEDAPEEKEKDKGKDKEKEKK